MSDYCVRPDHAILPNPSAKNADILADPRTVSDRDPFCESNRLMQDRAGNVLILMKVVCNIDVVRGKHMVSNHYLAHSCNVIVVAEDAPRTNLQGRRNPFKPDTVQPAATLYGSPRFKLDPLRAIDPKRPIH